jgi:TonB family C-terminal domain
MVSTLIHILLIIGAGLFSPHPSVKIIQPYFELVGVTTIETAGTSGQPDETGSVATYKTKSEIRKQSGADYHLKFKNIKMGSSQLQRQKTQAEIKEIQESNMTDPVEKTTDSEQHGLSSSDNELTEKSNGSVGDMGFTGANGVAGTGGSSVQEGRNSEGHFFKPVNIYQVKSYPQEARRKGWEGVVKVEATIGNNGRVEKINLIQSSGYKVLDDSALKAVRKWRYRPATQDGKPVECILQIPIRFKLEDE